MQHKPLFEILDNSLFDATEKGYCRVLTYTAYIQDLDSETIEYKQVEIAFRNPCLLLDISLIHESKITGIYDSTSFTHKQFKTTDDDVYLFDDIDLAIREIIQYDWERFLKITDIIISPIKTQEDSIENLILRLQNI